MTIFDRDDVFFNPIQFFSLSCDCRMLEPQKQIPLLKGYSLPLTAELTGEDVFADVAAGWSDEGLGFLVKVRQSPKSSHYPQIEEGDSVELFLDTRDLKSAGYMTRFCHHFFFLPQAVEGSCKGEMTRFRSEDSHPLCSSEDLYLEVEKNKNGYTMQIFIPSQCLHGYDPKQFNRLGFSYRINRFGGNPQHFSAISQEYQIDKHPSLWGTLILKTEVS